MQHLWRSDSSATRLWEAEIIQYKEIWGFHGDINSYCVVLWVMTPSSMADEYKHFGAATYPWASWRSQYYLCFISGRSHVQTTTCRLAIMTEAHARIVLLREQFLMFQTNTASFKCRELPTQCYSITSPRRLESSAPPPWEPQIFQTQTYHSFILYLTSTLPEHFNMLQDSIPSSFCITTRRSAWDMTAYTLNIPICSS